MEAYSLADEIGVRTEDVNEAVHTASAALRRGLPAHEAASVLDRAAVILAERRESLAELVCREVDKPISLAGVEVDRATATLRFSAAEARTMAGRVVPMGATPNGAGKLAFTERVPRGVIGAITPFNFPVNLVAHKIAPAIAAGCPVVLKPAPQAPQSALAFAEILLEAGLPDDWLVVLPGGADVAGAIVDHPAVPVLSFTGSVIVGWDLAARAAEKKVLLELGGSAPAIVTAGADLASAAASLCLNSFAFAGQSCVSVQRVYVEQTVADEFIEHLLVRAREVRIGDVDDPEVICGPVIDAGAARRLAAAFEEAEGRGARLLLGGGIEDREVAPTVFVDVPHEAALIQDEAFGPVVSVQRVASLPEAIERANGTRFGLQAAIFTESLTQAVRAMRGLSFGAVLVNEAPTFRADHAPYGGNGDSGNTREGPGMTVREFTEERLMLMNVPGEGSGKSD